MTTAVTPTGFDLDRRWTLDARVSVRPEPFGALLYHFGTRTLSFLKDRTLLEVVQALPSHPSARAACTAAGVEVPADLRRMSAALAALHRSHMIVEAQ